MKKSLFVLMALAAMAMGFSSCEKSGQTVEGQWFCGREVMPGLYNIYVFDVKTTQADSIYFAIGIDGTDPVIQSEAAITSINYSGDHKSGKIMTRDAGGDGYLEFKDLSKDEVSILVDTIWIKFAHPTTKLKLVRGDL